jgi:hypothetical protein
LIESNDVLDEEYEKYEGKFEKYEILDLLIYFIDD